MNKHEFEKHNGDKASTFNFLKTPLQDAPTTSASYQSRYSLLNYKYFLLPGNPSPTV